MLPSVPRLTAPTQCVAPRFLKQGLERRRAPKGARLVLKSSFRSVQLEMKRIVAVFEVAEQIFDIGMGHRLA